MSPFPVFRKQVSHKTEEDGFLAKMFPELEEAVPFKFFHIPVTQVSFDMMKKRIKSMKDYTYNLHL